MKYYLALRFAGRGDLHMTVRFFGKALRPKYIAAIEKHRPGRFKIRCTTRLKMGFTKKVKALGPDHELPEWVHDLAPKHWVPHITCKERSLDLLVTHVAIMSKQREIYRWELQ